MKNVFLVVLMVGAAAGPVVAQPRPAVPPPPEKFHVTLRYRLPDSRNLHVVGYDKLVDDLKAMKFEFDPPPLEDRPESDREDTSKNYFKGTIAPDKIPQLLIHPIIANVLIVPVMEGFKLPEPLETPEAPVRIRVQLAGTLQFGEQKDLSDQTRLMLELLGFREATGYDHRGLFGRPFTRLEGQVSLGALELLLKDLRLQPANWFESRFVFNKLPTPLRNVNPVQLVEVLPDPQPLEALKTPGPREPASLEKITPDLWELTLDKEKADQRVRVQVLFGGEPTMDDLRRDLLSAAPLFQFEGHLGNSAVGLAPPSQLAAIAAVSNVSTIRRPRVTLPDVYPGTKSVTELKQVLKQSGLQKIHDIGYRGKGVRMAILDRDFRQWQKFIENKDLPANTRLVDLTIERSTDLQPMPNLKDDAAGHGTLVAMAAAQGAPEAEITLIRIDPTDPYQIVEILGYFKGEKFSETIVRRFDELTQARAELAAKRRQIAEERQFFLKKFPAEDELDLQDAFEFLGPAYGWVFLTHEFPAGVPTSRTLLRQKMVQQDQIERAHADREQRYRDLLDAIRSLVGIPILVNPYVWNDGFPLGGSSPLTRWFDLRPTTDPMVFQSAGNHRGQTWTDLYHDRDRNGIMEFAGPETPLPEGRWTRELNFLAWQPYNGMRGEIPAGTRLRVSLQWREPHDSEYFSLGVDDPYREPLVSLRLVLLRQRDPHAKALSADSFELIARTNGLPERIQHTPGGDVYEAVLDTSLEKEGVYVVRVERQLDHKWILEDILSDTSRPRFELKRGLNPTGLRPVSAPTLPVLEKNWEFRPRLYVEAVGDKALFGRPVWADFSTDAGTLGVPGDSRGVFTVTALGLDNKTLPYAVVGTPAYLDLAKNRLLYAHDAVGDGIGSAFGVPLANAFAAGMAASLLSSSQTPAEVRAWLRQHQGYVLRMPGVKNRE